MLITGSSGIGKSETALELVKRGHRLVADDAVEITQSKEGTLVGHAPELIRYLLEIRGTRDHQCHDAVWGRSRAR